MLCSLRRSAWIVSRRCISRPPLLVYYPIQTRGLASIKRRRKAPPIPPSVDLPPADEWVGGIQADLRTKPLWGRISISNTESADKLAEAFVPEGSKDKVIIEAYPGPGLLTRSLLNLPKERIRKIVVMEHIAGYLDWLRPLQAIDDRLSIIESDPYLWTTYDILNDQGHLRDIPILGWDAGVHPTLQFIQHLPSAVIGEQLFNQYIRAIPDRHWLFKYGRVRLDLLLSSRLWQRLTTPPSQAARCKLGVFREATTQITQTLPPASLDPYQEHFYPPPGQGEKDTKHRTLESRKLGTPHLASTVIPSETPYIKPKQLDSWDYVTRKLFISKATPVSKSIATLAPGANILLKGLTDPNLPPEERVDVKKSARELTVDDWKRIVDVFEKWPFRPENLSIDVDFVSIRGNSRR